MIIKDFLTCFWLFLPIFVWNALFYKKLPKEYQNNSWDRIPRVLNIFETIFRLLVFIIPIILRFKVESSFEFMGLILYLVGLLVYFGSWIIQIKKPNSKLAKSKLGFMSLAYTTIIFFTAIVFIGQENLFGIKYLNYIYGIIILVFVLLHTLHAGLIHKKIIISTGKS